jgi:hypothetical protein
LPCVVLCSKCIYLVNVLVVWLQHVSSSSYVLTRLRTQCDRRVMPQGLGFRLVH